MQLDVQATGKAACRVMNLVTCVVTARSTDPHFVPAYTLLYARKYSHGCSWI